MYCARFKNIFYTIDTVLLNDIANYLGYINIGL